MRVRCTANKVKWEGGGFTVRVKPIEAIHLGGQIVVVHDYMAYPRGEAAPNLVTYSLTGEQIWVAENPGSSATNAYVEFISESPLIVGNFAGINCTIDPFTGKILHARITK